MIKRHSITAVNGNGVGDLDESGQNIEVDMYIHNA